MTDQEFTKLVTECRPHLFMYLQGRFHLQQEVLSDIVQESLLRAYQSKDNYDPDRNFKTWLYQISINYALSFLRKPAWECLEYYSNSLYSGEDPSEYAEKNHNSPKIKRLLESLPDMQKDILWFYYFEGFSLKDLEQLSGMSAQILKVLLKQAELNLRARYYIES